MTAAQRSIMSFLDLALITTGVMAMLASVGDRHSAAAGAISETFGAAPRSVVEHALPVSQLFEPQDARLSDAGTAALAELALASPTVEIGITVPVVSETGGSRLDRWELAAARTAAIMRGLMAQGIGEAQLAPDLARPSPAVKAPANAPGKAAPQVMLTVREAPAAR